MHRQWLAWCISALRGQQIIDEVSSEYVVLCIHAFEF